MLKQIELISEEQCKEVVNTVDALASYWRPRDERLPFLTLGVAGYIDGSDHFRGNEAYYAAVDESNQMLQANFTELYDKVLQCVAEQVGQPCYYAAGQALPGFHIFKSHPEFLKPLGSRHFDFQYKNLHWPEEAEIKPDGNKLSFTLALELPSSGAGMNIWPQVMFDSKKYSRFLYSNDHFLKKNPGEFIEYAIGHMLIHTGLELHQIASLEAFQEGERRITLQGHGIEAKSGTFLLYW